MIGASIHRKHRHRSQAQMRSTEIFDKKNYNYSDRNTLDA